MKMFRAAVTGVFLFALGWQLNAQSTAQIQGQVRDATGAIVLEAEIKVTQTETSTLRTAVSASDGSYVLLNLPIGPYRMEVSKPGFATYVQTGIVLQVGSQSTVDVSLKIGNVSEQVQVEANAALVETQNTNLGTVIENQRILELPLNGRQATDLIQLAGAAIPQGVAGAGGFPGTGQIVIAGGQAFGVGYYLDGGLYNNPWDNANLPFPFPDALQEFRVETSALDAAKGVHAGASINAVTRSGSNSVHGDVFEFLRNNALNAQNFFTNASPTAAKDSLKRNQFGGTIGGRIIRDKLFVFGGYQNTITRQSVVAPAAFVPTAAMQTGDFTACPSAIPASLASSFPGGKLAPGLKYDSASLNLAKQLPATSDPCGRVQFSYPTQINEYQVVGRVDYQITSKQSLFGRYLAATYYRPAAYTLAPTNLLTTGQAGLDDLVQSGLIGHTWVISPTTINTVRAAVNRVAINRFNTDFFSGCDLGVQMYCGYLPHQSFFTVTSGFSLGVTTGTKGHNANTTYQLGDDVSLVKGSHQLGFGVLMSEYRLGLRGTVYAQNQYAFPSLAAFLLGGNSSNPVTVTTSAPNPLEQKKRYFSAYIRDSWKVSSRLTVNVGLRYEPFLPPQMTNGAVYNFSEADMKANKKTIVYTNSPPGLTFPGDPGFPEQAGMYKQWALFAPRIGVAWDPIGSGRSSVRASYGLSYDYANGQLFVNTADSPPFGNTEIFPAASFTNPFASNPGGNIFPYTLDKNAPFAPAGVFIALQPNSHTTEVHQWNFALQRGFGRTQDWVASATYAGSQTSHLWVSYQLNPGAFIPGNCVAGQYGLTAAGPCSNNTNTNFRRAFTLNNYPQAGLIQNMDQYDDGGTSSYNGLILALQKRMSRGFSLGANYSYSHCIGDFAIGNSTGNAGTNALVIPTNRRQDRSNCLSPEIGGTFSSDRRHIFNLTAVGEAPRFNNSTLRAVVSGWQLAGIYRVTSAQWLTVTMTPADRQLSGTGGQRPLQILQDTACAAHNYTCWINTAAFAFPALGSLSTMNRGNVPGPNFWQLDLSLTRIFPITERYKFQVRGEAFNLTNSFRAGIPLPSLAAGGSGVITTFGSPNFGQITSALDPRVLQLAMKFAF
jgi:hypothetical protein